MSQIQILEGLGAMGWGNTALGASGLQATIDGVPVQLEPVPPRMGAMSPEETRVVAGIVRVTFFGGLLLGVAGGVLLAKTLLK